MTAQQTVNHIQACTNTQKTNHFNCHFQTDEMLAWLPLPFHHLSLHENPEQFYLSNASLP